MRPIRWYLKGIFPVKFTLSMYSVFLLLEWIILNYSPSRSSGVLGFVDISVLLVNPFILLSSFLHVYRSKETTLFELSLLSSWGGIALARTVSALLNVLAFWCLQAVFIVLVTEPKVMTSESFLVLLSPDAPLWLVPTSLNFFVNYITLGLLISLMSNRTSSLLLGAFVFFFMPISVLILIGSYQQNGIELSGPMAYFAYFMNPESTYLFRLQYPNLVDLSLTQGFVASMIISTVLALVYYLAFTRLQFKP